MGIRHEIPPQSAARNTNFNKNNGLRRKKEALLKEFAKLEQASQSKNGSIIVQSEMTMIGLLLNPTKADVSPEGLLPHGGAIRSRASMQANPAARPYVVTARLRLLFIRWKAAAIAYRERQTALLALHRARDRDLNSKRIYRGPIDDALERAAWLRKALKQP